MVVRVLKQRIEEGYGQVGFQFIPQTLEIKSMDQIDLSNPSNQSVLKQEGLFDEELFNEE
jgi:hypothetical protein